MIKLQSNLVSLLLIFNRSFNFSKETNDVDTLTTASLFLFDSILKSLKLPIEEVRGVGLQISGLSSVEKKNPLSKYFNADSTSPTKQQLSSPKQKTKIPDESNFVNNNITISQIDYSVFNQLPDNLKQEYNSFFKTNTPKRQKLQHSKHDKIIPVISEFRPIEIDGFVSSGDEILDEMLLNHEWVLAQNYIQVNGLSHDLLNSLMKFI